MVIHIRCRLAAAAVLFLSLSACSTGDLFGGDSGKAEDDQATVVQQEDTRESVWDLFDRQSDPNTTVQVNRYIWNASLEVLDFLPLRTVDPFSGVIVTDWGEAPGSGKRYRATVYIKDPALDARSLRVSLLTESGPADPDTVRQVEDAILTKARQLRIADLDL